MKKAYSRPDVKINAIISKNPISLISDPNVDESGWVEEGKTI